MKKNLSYFISALSVLYAFVSCEELDNDPSVHVDPHPYVELSEVAELLSDLPIQSEHLHEVHDAVKASTVNGYDEEYTMNMLFASPGSGVGDNVDTRASDKYQVPLKELIVQAVTSSPTKSLGAVSDPDRWLDALMNSDIQIYWPYSDCWDGKTLPIITFDPEDESDVNIGYRIYEDSDGERRVEEVMVDEEMAMNNPVWVVNRNSDASYKTLEMLRKENPEWGEGGGNIIVQSSSECKSDVKGSQKSRALFLDTFRMWRNYDCWFAGASEFFIKIGYVEDFTASTEAELRLYNPKVTDFMIVVRRSQQGYNLPCNILLMTDWTDQMSHCAFMISEDDGGFQESWKCTALVRISSRSYGIEVSLPINSWDDIVWRGRLSWDWLEANDRRNCSYGDVDISFDVVEY